MSSSSRLVSNNLQIGLGWSGPEFGFNIAIPPEVRESPKSLQGVGFTVETVRDAPAIALVWRWYW